MNGLYKRVLTGKFAPINNNYSKHLADVITRMLKVDPNQRPSTMQILELDYVV
jgi:serine/threonine protein kinase